MSAVSIADPATAVNGTSAQRPYVFVYGGDGSVWVAAYDGVTWPPPWNTRGTPQGEFFSVGSQSNGAFVRETISAISIEDPTTAVNGTSAQRPYVFTSVNTGAGDLWVLWWNGEGWGWHKLGIPFGRPLVQPTLSAISIVDPGSAVNGTSAQRPYVFVASGPIGVGNKILYVNWWDGVDNRRRWWPISL